MDVIVKLENESSSKIFKLFPVIFNCSKLPVEMSEKMNS